MRGPIYVFHTSENERQALSRDLAQAQVEARVFDTPAALTLAARDEAPAIVLWDLDAGKVRGGAARLAAKLGAPVVGLTTDRQRSTGAEASHTLLLPFERWRVAPVVLRLLQSLPERQGDLDEAGIFGEMRVVADTIRQRPVDFIDPSVLEPPPLPGTHEARARYLAELAPAVVPQAAPPLGVLPGGTPDPEAAPAHAPPAGPAAAPGPVRVLIADDDEVLQHILGYQLEALAWAVAATGDGEDALHRVRHGAVDVLLLDLNLPHRNAFEILEQLGPLPANVRVVVMSEQVQEEKIVRAFALGAHDFVQKPFNPRVVVSRIERLLKAG